MQPVSTGQTKSCGLVISGVPGSLHLLNAFHPSGVAGWVTMEKKLKVSRVERSWGAPE